MAVSGKDSDQVMQFLALYAQLRDWTEDDPTDLVAWAGRDDSIKELCKQLWFTADMLRMNENSRPELFATPVDPAFADAWRDFEERYEYAVSDVFWADILPGLPRKSDARQDSSRVDLEWEMADSAAETESAAIEAALAFAADQADPEREFPEDLVENIEEGLGEWARLKREFGFDLRGVLRRRRLIPFVLVPRQVAIKYGTKDKVSMLANLRSAHDAFVFGAPLAALAMMRSIMEAVLRDHYGADGRDLNERIRNARGLPRVANAASLHRLRKRANAVLHLDAERGEVLAALDAAGLEKEIVSLLFVLRSLIEGAPPKAGVRLQQR